MKFRRAKWLFASVIQCCAMMGALAAKTQLVDYSCPSMPQDQSSVFDQGTEPLRYSGVVHIEDHSQAYRLTFRPRYDDNGGYFDTIVVVGVNYTLDFATQAKTYFFDKETFRQQIVNIPILYCRSHLIPYSRKTEMTLGRIEIGDESGRKKTSIVSLQNLLTTCDNPRCRFRQDGLVVLYGKQKGDLDNVQFGKGSVSQDIRIMKPATQSP